MAEEEKKPTSGIPSWQQSSTQSQQTADAKPESASSSCSNCPPAEPKVVHDSGGSSPESTSVAKETPDSFSREEVVRFLEDPGVRDAPEDKKRAFLEAKGVSKAMVDEILLAQIAQADTTGDQKVFDVAQFKTRTTQSPAAPRDAPPIVTYPEFLVKPQKPPPLVTMSGLLNTAYIAGSLAAAFYGASKYIIEPMTMSLTEARHDFAAHSQQRLDTMNEKLASRVSKLPEQKRDVEAQQEVESVTSDPTELFYHDVGVQTSPPASRRSSSTDSAVEPVSRKSPIVAQETRLRTMKGHLDGLLKTDTAAVNTGSTLQESVQDLREYLSGLVYAPPASFEYGMWSGTSGSADKAQKKDAVGALRDEIRGVKGVLLSARRFPIPGTSLRTS